MIRIAYTIFQRIEPYGWDADDRTYYVLDDNRVYRAVEAPEPASRKPKKHQNYGTSRRSGRRRHRPDKSITEDCAPAESLDSYSPQARSELGGMSWECVAVTLDDVRRLVNSFRKTRDANEKILRNQLDVHLLPILEKQEESRKRKEAQHQRELLSLAKMANAKRSSRIAGKIEQHKEEEKAREQRETAQKQLESQQRERQNQLRLERERDFRLFSREKRLKERAARRHLHEEELAQLSEGHSSASDGRTRISDRQLQSEIDRNRLALKALEEEEEEEDWTFDCVCGLYGQVDDGAHSVACERCNVWQHSSCIEIEESEADRADFHFICGSCRRQTGNASSPRKTVIKLKVRNSNEVICPQSDGRTSQANSPLMMNSSGLDISMNTSEVSNSLSNTQSGIIGYSTSLKTSSGTDFGLFSDGNAAGNTISATSPTLVVGTSKEPIERVTDAQPTSIPVDDAAHVAVPPDTKSIPQVALPIGSTFSTRDLGSSVNSTTLPAHTTHSTAPQQVHLNGLPQMHSTRPSADQLSRPPIYDAPTENQSWLQHVTSLPAHSKLAPIPQSWDNERLNAVNASTLPPPLQVSENIRPVPQSELQDTRTDKPGGLTSK